MSEEKKVEVAEEDKKEVEAPKEEEQEEKKEDEEEQPESEVDPKEEGKFEKDNEFVPASKYNQTLRKQRELEAEKRELEKKFEEASKSQQVENKEEKKEDEEDDDFFKDEEEEKVDPSALIDEKLKPVLETLSKQEKDKKRQERDAFFDSHPEYAESGEKFQALLDEMDNTINPNSTDSYYVQLEKAHRILAGDYVNTEVEKKQQELAGDASSSESGAEQGSLKEEFTAEDKELMRKEGISEDAMRALKEKMASGSMQILS